MLHIPNKLRSIMVHLLKKNKNDQSISAQLLLSDNKYKCKHEFWLSLREVSMVREDDMCGCLRKSVSYSTNVDVIWDNFLMDNLSLHIKSHKIFIFFDLEVLTLRNKHRSEVSLLLITFLSPLAYKRTQSDYKSYSAFFNKKACKQIQSLGKKCHGNIYYVLSEKDGTVCVQYYN